MIIKFKIHRNHYQMILKSLDTMKKIIMGEWTVIADVLRNNTFDEDKKSLIRDDKEFVDSKMIKLRNRLYPLYEDNEPYLEMNPYLKHIYELENKFSEIKINNSDSIKEFEMNLDENHIATLKKAADLYIRVALTQIEEISMLMFNTRTKDGKLYYVKGFFLEYEEHNMIHDTLVEISNPAYMGTHDCLFLSRGASFGIHSDNVDDNVRILYDFYKVLMYESGEKGVYGYKPRTVSKTLDVYPYVIFPIVDGMTYIGEDDYFNKFTNGEYKHVYEDNNKIYLPYAEHMSVRLDIGDKIYKKYNRRFIIEKKDGNRFEE